MALEDSQAVDDDFEGRVCGRRVLLDQEFLKPLEIRGCPGAEPDFNQLPLLRLIGRGRGGFFPATFARRYA